MSYIQFNMDCFQGRCISELIPTFPGKVAHQKSCHWTGTLRNLVKKYLWKNDWTDHELSNLIKRHKILGVAAWFFITDARDVQDRLHALYQCLLIQFDNPQKSATALLMSCHHRLTQDSSHNNLYIAKEKEMHW